MSWLRQGLSQSITGGISQLKGQLEDILTEGTEEIIDPQSELKVSSDKLKEYERQIELVKIECSRWQEESAELTIKCQTYEAQLNQKAEEYKKVIAEKDAKLESLQKPGHTSQVTSIDFTEPYQKSALMEDFEELVPANEFSDYIKLQKEIKRLNEDNQHFMNENKQLLNRIKNLEAEKKEIFIAEENQTDYDKNLQIEYESRQKKLENTIDELKQEIFVLQNKLETSKDKHQEEIIGIQQSYKDRVNVQLNENLEENILLKEQLQGLQEKLKLSNSSELNIQISSNKSDDGWSMANDDDINLDIDSENLQKKTLSQSNEEVANLKSQLSKLENDLEASIILISKLKKRDNNKKDKRNNSAKSPPTASLAASANYTQTTTFQEFDIKHTEEIKLLKSRINELEMNRDSTIESNKGLLTDNNDVLEKLNLELKQLHETINQEKILQITQQKDDNELINNLKSENSDLNVKLNVKNAEISSLSDQIAELNSNINTFTSNDADFSIELQEKNNKITNLKFELEDLTEQKKQFEFVLDEKTREISQLKIDTKEKLEHIEAQSKLIEEQEKDETNYISPNKSEGSGDENKKLEELTFFKTQYNQIYGYLEQKNLESLNYYNEIQRLNIVLSDSNVELQMSQSQNENLNQQCENLVKEFQTQQKMVEDLNEQTYELNNTLSDTKKSVTSHLQLSDDKKKETEQQPDIIKTEKSVETENQRSDFCNPLPTSAENIKQEPQYPVEKDQSLIVINQMKTQIDELLNEKNAYYIESQSQINDLNKKLDQTIDFYEAKLNENDKKLQDNNEISLKLDQTVEYYENQLKNQGEIVKNMNIFKQNEEELKLKLDQAAEYYENELIQKNEDIQNMNFIQLKLKESTEYYENQLKLKDDDMIQNTNSSQQIEGEMNLKLNQTIEYYESQLKLKDEAIQNINHGKQQGEDQLSQRLTKELERLREHLVEMSDSYTNEAVQAEERERQLRLALNDAKANLQENSENKESSNKEIEERLEKLTQYNQKLKKDYEQQEGNFKKSEFDLNKQLTVTKNLELVLERLQNENNNQHSMEIKDYHKTIKDQNSKIYSLQREIKNHKQEVDNMKEAINEIQILEMELKEKDEKIKQLKTQLGSKDVLIESLEKRINETKKLNNDFIEKAIIKSLVIGYIKVQKAQEKKQVIKLIGTMLNFTPSEFEHIESATDTRWFGYLKSATPTKSTNNLVAPDGSLNSSFTDLFIQYVDQESKPKPNFSFDINTEHKKTDGSPGKPENNKGQIETSVLTGQVNNNNTISRNFASNQAQVDSAKPETIISSQIASPATANSFLEQILK